MSDDPHESREPNPLIQRVDALMRRQQEDSQRAVQEVPLLTEVVEPEGTAAAAREARPGEQALAEDIERVLLVRLVPELARQIAVLRTELEKELRRAVREAVAHAIAEGKKKPAKP